MRNAFFLDATDVVCVIGVIQVKCMGSVRAGERIYATVDPENPGTAIPESNLPPSVLLSQSSILLGMSMGEKKSPKLDDVNMVQCFVCIVLGITDVQITSEIETIYDRFKMDLNVKLQKERTKYRRSKYGYEIFALFSFPASNWQVMWIQRIFTPWRVKEFWKDVFHGIVRLYVRFQASLWLPYMYIV